MLSDTISRRTIIGFIAVAVVAAGMVQVKAPSARAFPGGSFLVVCDFVKFKRVDPIGQPGVYPSAHLHQFFGNRGVHKSSTYRSLVRGTTKCSTDMDRSSYWSPVFYKNGKRLTPYQVSVYYVADGRDRKPFPLGFKHRTEDVRYSCGGGTSREPRDCGGGQAQFNVRFFHQKFPDVHVHFKYRVSSLVGARLSSGSLATAHGDFFPAWAGGKLRELVNDCLNKGRTCGKIGRRT
jgi:hypothetical protein